MAEPEPLELRLAEDEYFQIAEDFGLDGLRRFEDLRERMRGSEYEADLLEDILYRRCELLPPEGAAQAVIDYIAEPLHDGTGARETALRVIPTLIETGHLPKADELIAALPDLPHRRGKDGLPVDDWSDASYTAFRLGHEERAIEIAEWAARFDGPTEAQRRAVHGHQLERAGKIDEALKMLVDDWDSGYRSELAADRISLIASRGGDLELACRVLEEAIERFREGYDDDECVRGPGLEALQKRFLKLQRIRG